MKPCVRGSRQHCVRKNLVQYCLNTPGAKLRRKNPMQCCLRGSKQHCTGKNLGNVCLNNVWSFRLHKYIRFFMSKEKNQVIKFTMEIGKLAKTETVAQHSTQQLVKFLVGCYLNK